MKYNALYILLALLILFFLGKKSVECFNILDYQFSDNNKPLQINSFNTYLNTDDPWVSIKKIFKPVTETSTRRISKYIEPPIVNRVVLETPKPIPKLIDYQFSQLNFPSEPINSMKVNLYAPWSNVKQVDKYIIPQTITPFGKNLYNKYIEDQHKIKNEKNFI